MKKNRKHTKRPQRASLSELVEREVGPSQATSSKSHNDSLDPDLELYVQSFLYEFMNNKPLPPTSLLTPDSAREALQVLDKTQQQIDRQLRTARALKGLLEQKQRENN